MSDLTDYTNAIMPPMVMLQDYGNRRKGRKQYEEDRKHQEELNAQWYERQRQDALADWQRQADYDSPAQQMSRLKAAGINPHLAFGKGGGENTSGVIRSSEPGTPASPGAPPDMTLDPGNKLLDYARLQNINAQTENTKVATQNASIETTIKSLLALGQATKNEQGLVDLNIKKRMADDLVSKLNAEMSLVSTQYQNALSIGETLAERMNLDRDIKKQIFSNLQTTGKLQAFELWAKRNGLDGNDPMYVKSLLKLILTGDF